MALDEGQSEAVALLALVAGQDVEPGTGLVTAAAVTMAAGADNSKRPAGSSSWRPMPASRAGERAGPGRLGLRLRADARHPGRRGAVALIKAMPIGRPVDGRFTINDFTIDQAARAATCPNGVARPISSRGQATFGAACAACPLRARCTTSNRRRKLVIGEHDQIRRELRARAR